MKLIKVTKTGKFYRLNDGRIGGIFDSGYVRVTVKRNKPNLITDINFTSHFYQINKQVKVCSQYRGFTHDIRRVLIECECERLKTLQQFELKNCK